MILKEVIETRKAKGDYKRNGVPKGSFTDGYWTGFKEAYQDLEEILEQNNFNTDIPLTADVVEVVRCCDCAVPHNKWTGCPKLNGLIPPPDFYCAYGERSKDNALL